MDPDRSGLNPHRGVDCVNQDQYAIRIHGAVRTCLNLMYLSYVASRIEYIDETYHMG